MAPHTLTAVAFWLRTTPCACVACMMITTFSPSHFVSLQGAWFAWLLCVIMHLIMHLIAMYYHIRTNERSTAWFPHFHLSRIMGSKDNGMPLGPYGWLSRYPAKQWGPTQMLVVSSRLSICAWIDVRASRRFLHAVRCTRQICTYLCQ